MAARKRDRHEDIIEIPSETSIPQDNNGTPNGVLVSKIINQTGGIDFSIQVVGEVQITEVDFILEMGRKVFRRQIGLDEQK